MLGRIVKWGAFAAVVVAVVLLSRATWRAADEIKRELLDPNPNPAPDLEVVAVGSGTVDLARNQQALRPGLYGLQWSGGYGRIREVLVTTADTVTRRFEPVEGIPAPGVPATLDPALYRGDPQTALGITHEGVSIEGELGPLPAWRIEGEDDTWVIIIHGRSSDGRRQALRVVESLAPTEFPLLVISHRNDPGAPPSEDGLFSWGFDEWRDLEAAARYALSEGAGDVVIVGLEAGGSAAAIYLQESSLARFVVGVVLDGPMLDLNLVEDVRTEDSETPGFIESWARALAAFRFELEWSRLDLVAQADRLRHPILLFHGGDDEVIPVEGSEALAAARPDLVTYERFEGAGHLASWNSDPERYRAALTSFLERIALGPTDVGR